MTAHFPSSHANKLQQEDEVDIWLLHSYRGGKKWEERKELDGARRGENKMKENTPCFRIQLRKMFRSKKTERTC